MEDRKWFLFSRTTWFNAISIGVLPLILTPDEIKVAANALDVRDFGELLVSVDPAFNIVLRLISWGAVGGGRDGKHWFLSKTVMINLLVIIFAGWLGYRLYEANVSLRLAAVIMAIGIVNVYLRVTHTTRRLTLLPGILGRIA
jgi:hypothetical protein